MQAKRCSLSGSGSRHTEQPLSSSFDADGETIEAATTSRSAEGVDAAPAVPELRIKREVRGDVRGA